MPMPFEELFAMFKKASAAKKYPSISFAIPSASGKRVSVKVYLATKGYIAILIDKEYAGKIASPSDTSVVLYGVGMDDPIRKAITDFCEHPIQTASELGKKYYQCCFCNTTLSTNISKAHGYGPICADNFGLPWGSDSMNSILSSKIEL